MSTAAVKIEHLSVCYGQNLALSDVCLDIQQGEYLGIIGPNGGGKTTLLKAVLGLIPASGGSISICGEKAGRGGQKMGYVPQITAVDKRFPISVLEVVLTGRLKQGLSPLFRFGQQDREKAYEALEKVGIRHLANRQTAALSGGEFQRMLIARALTVEPEILILDEPTASVDVSSCSQIYSLLKELNKELTIIMVSHDLLAVSDQVSKLACLNQHLLYYGEPKLSQEMMVHLYGCPVELPATERGRLF
ncbi:ABC transporter ATP-binding protein [Aminipila butyrica]|uniref:ABC transporter ATP-binding protein n=1 Tax=Aminipila butyrica TaxID=433296 RepID=A0A858BTS0_9FIRM|nr:ABC transporter ATP-binding protein [Aminipila butyrica]QIB68957.1 ABC transporter ATP-binding protein [Aminipila butyrica]